MTRLRKNVLDLPAGDQTLEWYGRAIAAMKNGPITDPTSWRFQAAIHEYISGQDPLAVAGEQLPSSNIQTTYWNQCQHGSWFFLPWHRMYLYRFEQIVLTEIVKLGGPSDWALPYWNYSASTDARLLPDAFRSARQADSSVNSLYVGERDPRSNDGQQFASERDTALRTALIQAQFSNRVHGNFGGLQTPFSHNGSDPGHLEDVPHGTMHVAVGGQTGWMSAFNTAALDPIFWLHHCNLDRLWEVWLKRDPKHIDPTSPSWLTTVSFPFYVDSLQTITMHCADVVDLGALGYAYDDVSDPLAATPAPRATPEVATMSETSQPELVGATGTSFNIQNDPVHFNVATPAHAEARQRLAKAAGTATVKPHVFLQLENLTSTGRANSYDVYVYLPEGGDPNQHPELYAGRLSMFGVAEASRATAQHAGSGLTVTLDITDIYQKLSTAPGWDPNNVRVSLIPVRDWEGSVVNVGRVSVFFG